MSTEDRLTVGTTLQGGSRTVTDAEIAILPALMGAINPLFHDEVAAQRSAMKGRILYGPALLGIAISLTEHLLRDRVMGLVELRTVRFKRPVKAGDTVTAAVTVRKRIPRQDKPGDLLHLDDEVRNQHGDAVMTFERVVLITGPTEGDQAGTDAEIHD